MGDPKMRSKPLRIVGGITLVLAVVVAIYFVLPTPLPEDLVVDGDTNHGSDSSGSIIEGRPVRSLASVKHTTIDDVLEACSIAKPPALSKAALEQVRMSIERRLRVQVVGAAPGEQDLSFSEIRADQKATLRRTGRAAVAGEYGTRTNGIQVLRSELRALQRGDYLAFPAGTGFGHWQVLSSEQDRSPFGFVYVDTFDFSGGKVDLIVFIPKEEL